MREEEFFIPKTLDEPGKWLWFTMDETLAIIGPVILGIAIGYMLSGILMSLFLLISLKKIKRGKSANILIFYIYWHYPAWILNLKYTPSSYVRNFYG